MEIDVVNLGLMDYNKALEIQIGKWQRVANEEERDTLFLVEHPPVITLGVRGKKENILVPEEELEKMGVSVVQVSRGGDVTYHGPGQIVGYPVMNLKHFGRDIHYFVEKSRILLLSF